MIFTPQAVHLTSQEELADLADIAVPDPVSWYPQTWGWWVLVGALVVAALVFAVRRIRRYVANRYRRAALEELAALEATLDNESRRAAALAELAVLLKRTALGAWPRAEVASLSGRAWIDFLRRHGGRTDIDERMAQFLDDTEYRPESLASVSPEDAQACAQAARGWIEGHRVSA